MVCQPGEYDDDGIIRLIGAVFRLAMRDAALGVRAAGPSEMDATEFLKSAWPELVSPNGGPVRTDTKKGEVATVATQKRKVARVATQKRPFLLGLSGVTGKV